MTLPGLASFDLLAFEKERVLAKAQSALHSPIRTITSIVNARSAGGPHDFSSEGDYWWPDPADPDGPYVRRDGLSNPDNFSAHRELLIDFADTVGALAAAFLDSRGEIFAGAALRRLRAWFVNADTRMNPDLQFAQAVKGICTGRGIGIIDTVHLAEVALAVEVLRESANWGPRDEEIVGWFRDYLQWLCTHPYGIEESREKNNHGTCWDLQVAAFSRVSGDFEQLSTCRGRLLATLLPEQMAADGSFPLELARTKPFAYSLFNLDVMGALARLLSDTTSDLVRYALSDGRSLLKGVEFIAPFIADKARWPYGRDVMYWDDWPVRQPCLLFGAQAACRDDWLQLWMSLPADPVSPEIRRNFPVRYPSLWRHLPF